MEFSCITLTSYHILLCLNLSASNAIYSKIYIIICMWVCVCVFDCVYLWCDSHLPVPCMCMSVCVTHSFIPCLSLTLLQLSLFTCLILFHSLSRKLSLSLSPLNIPSLPPLLSPSSYIDIVPLSVVLGFGICVCRNCMEPLYFDSPKEIDIVRRFPTSAKFLCLTQAGIEPETSSTASSHTVCPLTH